jgi:hypothetical protein
LARRSDLFRSRVTGQSATSGADSCGIRSRPRTLRRRRVLGHPRFPNVREIRR